MERLSKALLNYNNLIQTKKINSAKHDKIVVAYWNVINAYNNLIDSITGLKKNKQIFKESHVTIMQDFLNDNPNLAEPSTPKAQSTSRKPRTTRTKGTTRTVGGYRTRYYRGTKRKRKIP